MSELVKNCELVNIVALNAVDLFEKIEVNALVDAISKQALSLVPDIETEEGRKDVIDLGKKIRKSSKILDDIGKEHVAILKAKPKDIDVVRKKTRDDLDAVYIKVRAPLEKWENDKREAEEAIQNKIVAMMAMPCGVASDRISDKIVAKIFLDELQCTVIDNSFGSSLIHAEKTKSENIMIVTGVIANFEQQEKEELERIETEKAEQKEREEQIAKNAKELAERDAAQSIQDEKDAREQSERDAAQAISDAKAAKELAVKNAKEAKEKAKQDAVDARAKAELAVKQASHIAKINAEKAIQDEKDRVEKARVDEITKQEKLAKNKKHSANINNEILSSILTCISKVHSMDENEAKLVGKAIIVAIAKKEIQHVSIKY